ncbi:transcriptional regulator, ArsR family [Methanocaldococcus vulcanius M7]|uniref:Transcriptional regulator, ArsR family n=1 Tax=Methanocaldococcus vulcanius (strain ATCC 700851 / DSM 12094 / M7) TaxID=579137 RepID=C9RFV3_METVM|nr:ArsR family transcriptional regulator [Methanocaldococcus vulcanius]ACX72455.1 transcriptional regulator, ArsR family [Methanocaldococcus vulcanius M7]
MIIKTLSKKYVREILEILNNKGVLTFSQLQKETKLHQGTLSRLLSELIEEGLVEKWTEETEYMLPKSCYKITQKGKNALILYKLDDFIEKIGNKTIKFSINENDKVSVIVG